MFAKLKAYAFQLATLVLLVLLAAQTVRLHFEQRAHDQLKVTVAEADRNRTQAALKASEDDAAKKLAHAAATQENVRAFTVSQPTRDAIARADLAVAHRLRIDAERRAATYRAQAQANAAACRDLADRLEALDRHVVEGTTVVAGLRAALDRRDAEVALSLKQVHTERALTEEP